MQAETRPAPKIKRRSSRTLVRELREWPESRSLVWFRLFVFGRHQQPAQKLSVVCITGLLFADPVPPHRLPDCDHFPSSNASPGYKTISGFAYFRSLYENLPANRVFHCDRRSTEEVHRTDPHHQIVVKPRFDTVTSCDCFVPNRGQTVKISLAF